MSEDLIVHTPPKPTEVFDYAVWQAQAQRRLALLADIRPLNKAAIFDVLATSGITRVIISFDGYGDSGQIETILAFSNEDEAKLPLVQINQTRIDWKTQATVLSDCDLKEALENLVYDFLEEAQCGWANNDGAYGDVVFEVAKYEIRLEYNQRVSDSHYYEYHY